ncbi:MAG: hypothetical protein FWC89_09270 [Defluviitaleaceae bacterium]|nr:hypothetical protein [Defluviitaleaceae bacterium]
MYKFVENPTRMTRKELRETFDGKWVFVVEGDYDINKPLTTAIPMIVADDAWEGIEEGIYDKLDDKYRRTAYLSYLKDELNVFGFTEVLQDE